MHRIWINSRVLLGVYPAIWKGYELSIIEIDSQVIDMAKNPALFTYLRDCSSKIQLLREDGLLAITKAAKASYELLVLDAFNSDAIPVHLLTLEAFQVYQKKNHTRRGHFNKHQ